MRSILKNVVGCMIGDGPSTYPLTCDPKDVLLVQEKLQEGIYYTADVMAKVRTHTLHQRSGKSTA